jgi:hypothetical protein
MHCAVHNLDREMAWCFAQGGNLRTIFFPRDNYTSYSLLEQGLENRD